MTDASDNLLSFRHTTQPVEKAAGPSPLVADAAALAVMLNAAVRTVRTWDAAGKLPAPLRIGGRVLWRVDEVRSWLEAGAPCRSEWEARKAASRK